ncbi:hypothetical protein LUZ60_000837 [Juncus effusus]|nr:hypothetical protein LUZ60_000837 [Juncus effusus]
MLFSSFNPSSGGESMDSAERIQQDFEPCEEGVGVSEEMAKPRSRSSGSKRSRAAEVHNLSEKRRRSRINEKMRALQSLIPNSNKTDKASMLDEAIDYLKQLQLQVQMLSMRNGMYLDPTYMSHFQASQMLTGLGMSQTGSDVGPANPDSASQQLYDQINRAMISSRQNLVPTNNVTNFGANTESLFPAEPSQPFPMPVCADMIFRGDLMPGQQLEAGQTSGNQSGNEMKSANLGTSQNFAPQGSNIVNVDQFEGCTVRKENTIPKNNAENQLFVQHLHGLQRGNSELEVKPKSKDV